MQILYTILGGAVGASIIGFIEFLIRRKDEKEDKNSEVLKRLDALDKKIDKIESNAAEREAVASRVRILHFMDELREGRKHSKDSFDQCLCDITTYEHYCAKNPDFKNSQTTATVAHINRIYAERLEKNDFLG